MTKAAAPKLTDKQRVFIDEYLVDLNGTQAAIRAGYSEDSARQSASLNLSNAVIRAEIDARLRARALSTDEIVDRLLRQSTGELPTKRVDRAMVGTNGQPTGMMVAQLEYDSHAALKEMAKIRKLHEPADGAVTRVLIVRDAREVVDDE